MQLSQEGLDLIKGFEGYHDSLPDGSCKAYRCPAGVWTIGYGCTEGVHEGLIITEAEAESRLRAELTKHEGHVNRLVTVDLTQQQFDALVSFCYNCGAGNLAKSTLLKRVNAGNHADAVKQFPLWNKADGVVYRGLTRRRAAEAELYEQGAGFATHEAVHMPQAVDAPLEATSADLRATSRKYWLTEWLHRGALVTFPTTLGLASVDPVAMPGMLATLAGVIRTHGLVVLGIAGLVMIGALSLMKAWMREDVASGRSTPSGAA